MSLSFQGGRRAAVLVTGLALAVCSPAVLGLSGAGATFRDRDGDGMPNRWERSHGLNPAVANARGDKDRDRLVNIAEYRRGIAPDDEDSDNDGHDDGDEVKDRSRSTDPDDRDTDDDGTRDGDEDRDRDGIDNEDEDDARESCRHDDDDVDADDVNDEDENELRVRAHDADSDDDGFDDGDEDRDRDGETNEDEDDSDDDRCEHADSHEDDDNELLGTITGFAGGVLSIAAAAGGVLSLELPADVRVEFKDLDEFGTTADLAAGTRVAEVEYDDEEASVEKVEIYKVS